MRNLLVALGWAISSTGIAFAQAFPIGELQQMFDYDQTSLHVKEVGVQDKSGISIRDISYASAKIESVR